MTAIQHLQAAQAAQLVNEDGEPVALKLSPPLSGSAIDALQTRVGLPLPEELRTLLAYSSGVEGCLDQIDFTGESLCFEQVEVFPNGIPIAADGYGNFWVLDITPETTAAAPVYFACHDAPVILYQSADLAGFLSEVFKMNMPPHQSLVNDVHDDRLFQVWRNNPQVIEHHAAAASTDTALKSFAARLSDRFQLIDLRNAAPGMGFSWGRYGPQTEVRRQGHQRLFAYAPPQRTGFLAKLLGR